MRFGFKGRMAVVLLVVTCFTGGLTPVAVDPDSAVLDSINAICSDTNKLNSMTSAELNSLLPLIDSVNNFFIADASTPSYSGWDDTQYSKLKNSVQLAINSKSQSTPAATTTTTVPTTTTTVPTTTTTVPTTTTTPTVVPADAAVLAAITTAMGSVYSVAQSKWTKAPPAKAMSDAVAGLNTLATTYTPGKSLGGATVIDSTRNAFASAVMAAGGSWALSIKTYAAKKSYSAADKTAIKALGAAIKFYGGAATVKKIASLLTNAANSNLLTSAQKTYVTGTLAPSKLSANFAKLSKVK